MHVILSTIFSIKTTAKLNVFFHKKIQFAEIRLISLFTDMAPYYEQVCKDLSRPLDKKLLAEMKAENEKELKKLDDKILEEIEYESDEKDALLSKAEYLCKIGDKVLKVPSE